MAAIGVVKSLTKLALGGGAVYATVQQGVWSTNTDQSSKVLQTYRTSVAPAASEYISKIPSGKELNQKVVSKWNNGVLTAFGTLAETPEYSKKALETTRQFIGDWSGK